MKSLSKFMLSIALLTAFSMSASAGYRVQDGRIYDANDQEVQLRGVNWFGFQQADFMVHGQWARNWRSQIFQMKNIGVNAVRLPLCPATLQNLEPNHEALNYTLNPELEGKKSLELLDMVVNELNNENMYVLLDHHTPDCEHLTELWYTGSYTEEQWLNDLEFMANRYKNLPYVIGIDIKNEPHGAATWGTGGATDWKRAAEAASNRILATAPNMLIFVEGIEDNNNALPATAPCSTAGHWWGGNFEPMNCYPLNIPADRLVLSPHVYGPDVYNQTYFNSPDFPNNMPAIWDLHFGSFAGQHPIVFGEFGGRYGHYDGDPKDIVWQNKIVDYMIEKNIRSSFYWAWNENSLDTHGILQPGWQDVWQDKVELLQRLWGYTPQTPVHGCSDGKDNDGDGLTDYPADFGCQSADDDDEFNYAHGSQGLQLTTVESNDWGTGYCKTIRVTNTNDFIIDWIVNQPADGTVTSFWSANYTQNGNDFVFEGLSWNDFLRQGQSTSFGFCVTRSAPPPPTAACADGQDNDGDGLVDTNDPGCANAQDTDETDGPASGYLEPVVTISGDWGSGYCADVLVTNTTSSPVDWTTNFPVQGTVTGLWGASYTQSGNTVTAEGFSWNNIIQPSGTVSFNFCANR